MGVKISKLQNRLNDRSPKNVSVGKATHITKPEGKHIVWMGLDDALNYNTDGYAVISIGNHDRTSMPEFGQAPALYLNFNPTFEKENWINAGHVSKMMEFLRTHRHLNVMFHCNYGSQRSAGLAIGYYEAIKHRLGSGEIALYRYRNSSWLPYETDGKISDYDNRCYGAGYAAGRKLIYKE